MRIFSSTMAKTVSAALVSAGLLLGATSAHASENLEWASGSPGGSWFSIVTGLANIVMNEHPDINIRIVPGGGRDNPSMIEGGISQMGLGIDFLAASAMRGEEPYNKPHPSLRSLGGQWAPVEFHVIVPSNDERSFAEIMSDPKVRIGTSPRSTSEELTLQRVLSFYKNTPDQISAAGGTVINGTYNQIIGAFQDSQIDVLFGAGSYPTGIALEIETGGRSARLATFSDELMDHLIEDYGYSKGEIPANIYPNLQPGGAAIPVTTMETITLIHEGISEETAYRITSAMLKNQDRFANIYQVLGKFDPTLAWQNQPVPLHPGAERAYRELGYMK